MKLMDFFIEIGVKDEGAVKSINQIDNSASHLPGTFDTAGAGANRLGGAFTRLRAGAMLVGAGLVYLGTKIIESIGAMASFVDATAGALDELGDFAEANGTTAAAISQLGYAAQLSGSDVDAVKSSIAGLNAKIGEAGLGVGRGAKLFEKFGIKVKDAKGKIRDTSDVLADIAGKMQGLSNQEAIAMASKLGIDASLVPLLLKGKDGIEQLTAAAKKNGAVTDEQAAAAGAYADMMDKAKFKIDGVKNAVATALMPSLSQLGEKLADVTEKTANWLVENELLEPVLYAIGGVAIMAIVGGLVALLAPLWAIIAATWAWTAALLANPLTWIILLVVGLIAAIVLLINWIIQNKAIFIAAYESMRAKVMAVIEAIKAKWNEFTAWISAKVEAIKQTFAGWISYLQGIDWLAPFRPMLAFFDMIMDKIRSVMSFKMPSWLGGSGGSSTGSTPGSPLASLSPTAGRGNSLVNNNQQYNVNVAANNVSSPSRVADLSMRGLRSAAMAGTA